MKTLILGAIALTVATPAMAQPAQPQNHQGHQMPAQGAAAVPAQHQGHDMAQHSAQGGQAMDHSEHGNCCRDANGNGKMDCCENMGAATQSSAPRQTPAPQPQAHQGH